MAAALDLLGQGRQRTEVFGWMSRELSATY